MSKNSCNFYIVSKLWKMGKTSGTYSTIVQTYCLHIIQANFGGGDVGVAVEEVRLYHHVPVQHLGWHHLVETKLLTVAGVYILYF